MLTRLKSDFSLKDEGVECQLPERRQPIKMLKEEFTPNDAFEWPIERIAVNGMIREANKRLQKEKKQLKKQNSLTNIKPGASAANIRFKQIVRTMSSYKMNITKNTSRTKLLKRASSFGGSLMCWEARHEK